MYKKYSNNKIDEFIDLGDGTYEFCFNIVENDITEDTDENISTFEADVILVKYIDDVVNCLLRDKYSTLEELKIINFGLSNKNNKEYIEYKEYIELITNKYQKFYLNQYTKNNNTYETKKTSVERINNKYLFRFNEKTLYDENDSNVEYINYDEYVFDEIKGMEDINIINDIVSVDGFMLNDNQCQYIMGISGEVLTLDQMKDDKISEFDPILNEFSVLIYRCKLIHENDPELENVISIIKNMKETTLNKINSYTTISEFLRFKYKIEDIEYMKNLLKKFTI